MGLTVHYNPNPEPLEWLLRRKVGKDFKGKTPDTSGRIMKAVYHQREPLFLLDTGKDFSPLVWVHAVRDRK